MIGLISDTLAATDTCYCLALCHYKLKQYAASLKYISEVIERGIRDHPELSVGMQTEGVDIRSVGNSSVSLCSCGAVTEWLSFFPYCAGVA